MGCEPEIGSPCDDNEDEVNNLVPQRPGTNNLVQDVGFDNCTQAFCLSADGGRPFCTKKCEADIECAEAGEGFSCSADVAVFGPTACLDFEDPFLPQPGSADPSGAPCAVSEDCTVEGEDCFIGGEFVDTCGFVGRDCLTGPGGGKSEFPISYCTASPDVIAARDLQFGRTP